MKKEKISRKDQFNKPVRGFKAVTQECNKLKRMLDLSYYLKKDKDKIEGAIKVLEWILYYPDSKRSFAQDCITEVKIHKNINEQPTSEYA